MLNHLLRIYTSIKQFNSYLILILLLSISINCYAQAYANPSTMEKYFNKIKHNRNALLSFLQKMPKGGDIHNHLGGASYAENLIQYAKTDNFCFHESSNTIINSHDCIKSSPLNDIVLNSKKYDRIIDAWSMRHYNNKIKSGYEHFFATFDKFMPIIENHEGQMLAETVSRAAAQHEKYLELMVTPDHGSSSNLANQLKWDNNFDSLRNTLLSKGLKKIVYSDSSTITVDEKIKSAILNCDKDNPAPGCAVKVRYLYQAHREQSPTKVFAQLLTGFELVQSDARFVGINLVQPEFGKFASKDYELHMKMIAFLHKIYPNVRISLHAGELTPAIVKANALNSHIREAIDIAHTQRIGHGVDILYEKNHKGLLLEMSHLEIPVEISLTSNALLFGITAKQSPFLIYLKYNIPIVLSTDDEGILRTDLSHEYFNAVSEFNLSYSAIKNIDRNSLTYSFIPGRSLWLNQKKSIPVMACSHEKLGSDLPGKRCSAFLEKNEKAQLQWNLEHDFNDFESKL